MASASDLDASGAGLSLPRLAMALSTMPSAGPSLAAKSNSTVSMPALVRWAAICAPMTPAPRTAARRTSRELDISINLWSAMTGGSGEGRIRCMCAHTETGFSEMDQLPRGLATVLGLADVGRSLDQAEIGHGVGQ